MLVGVHGRLGGQWGFGRRFWRPCEQPGLVLFPWLLDDEIMGYLLLNRLGRGTVLLISPHSGCLDTRATFNSQEAVQETYDLVGRE